MTEKIFRQALDAISEHPSLSRLPVTDAVRLARGVAHDVAEEQRGQVQRRVSELGASHG